VQQSERSDTFALTVNGVTTSVVDQPDRSLLEVLRDELDVTGPKPGCGEGVCGACTVLLDGEPVRSCRTPVSAVDGRRVLTIEGLSGRGELHPVQAAFLEQGAFQCGYCTPGMILSAVALLDTTPDPDDEVIRAALDDNVCRCGAYARILAAVSQRGRAVEAVRGAESMEPPSIDLDRRPRAPWDLTPTAERDWFDVLPEGLVVVVEAETSGGWSTTSGAWLHVGGDGMVTAFTGKVDAGQDNRTGLCIDLAEAIGLPLSQVRLVMGDTDLCPHDMGTFGSRSTPDAGRELRALGTATRDLLTELATTRGLPADRTGDLVHGMRRVEVAARPRSGTRPAEAGRALPPGVRRLIARSIVTGTKRYPSDVMRRGMRHGVVLRPPAADATLRSVQLDDVGVDDVIVVHDGAFVGVVARTPTEARHALARAKPVWDLPETPREADLEAHLRANPIDEEGWEGGFDQATGDVDSALANAEVRLTTTYTTAFIAHVPMETRAAVAGWSDDGRLTIWTGTQVPFGVREEVADALGIPEAAVRVIVPDFGGGFGGKHTGPVAVEAARLARTARTSVKVRWTREDEFRHGYLRPAAVIDIEAGASRDGRLTGWRMTNLNSGTFGLEGPYEVPDQRLVYQPAESPLRQGSYRGLAATANHFARESAMDELAVALEIDPLELRLTHLGDDRLAGVLKAAAERIGWTRKRERGNGIGLAGGVEKDARVATAVGLQVDAERRVRLTRIVTAFDCGRIVNPDALTNQIEGAMSMGLGAALFEAVHFDAGGVLTNASMTDYRVPRITDLPPIEVILHDRPDVPSAGAGETPIIALAPAIANAIFDATGVRLRAMPLLPTGRLPD
jgi:nicotinate dehydrogenase subunit B